MRLHRCKVLTENAIRRCGPHNVLYPRPLLQTTTGTTTSINSNRDYLHQKLALGRCSSGYSYLSSSYCTINKDQLLHYQQGANLDEEYNGTISVCHITKPCHINAGSELAAICKEGRALIPLLNTQKVKGSEHFFHQV
jgi:hypothetical protein